MLMPSQAIVDSIDMGVKVVILGGSQIKEFYSKKFNPIFRFQVRGQVDLPQLQP